MIEFAKLSKQEKDKYIKFLVDNNIEFQQNDSGFTASFKMQNKENMDPKKRVKTPTKTPTKSPARSVSPLKRKLSRDETLSIIQEIYSKKFEDASKQLKQKNIVSEDFGVFVMRFAQNKQIDMRECMQMQDDNVLLFKKFLLREYEEEDLMYFLFLRAIVEKELGQAIYQSKRSLDLQKQFLTIQQVQSILQSVYENDVNDEEILKRCRGGKISAFEFMVVALSKYHSDRQPKDKLITETVLKELRTFFFTEVEGCNEQLFGQVQIIATDLLQSIFSGDKRIWINRVKQAKPEELLYLEGLIKEYNQQSDVKQFCRKVLQTPQLGKCFGKLFD